MSATAVVTANSALSPTPPNLSGQINGLNDQTTPTIPQALYGALRPSVWRLSAAVSEVKGFVNSFGTNPANWPTMMIGPDMGAINAAGRPANFTNTHASGNLAADLVDGRFPGNCYTCYKNMCVNLGFGTSPAPGPMPAGTYFECCNEFDLAGAVNWNETAGGTKTTAETAAMYMREVAQIFQGFQTNAFGAPYTTAGGGSRFKIVAPTLSDFDNGTGTGTSSWFYVMLNEFLTPSDGSAKVLIDALSWHNENNFNSPTSASPAKLASDIYTADATYRGVLTWAAIGATTMALCVNEYANQPQWTKPGALLGYLSAMETASPHADIACRTCWSTYDTQNGCFGTTTMAYLLSTNGENLPTGIYELYRRYADSQGYRLTATQSDSTIATMAYSPPGPPRVSVLLGASGSGTGPTYGAWLGQATDSFVVTLNGLGSLFADGTTVQCRTTLLDRYAIGVAPAQAIAGTAVVASGSVSFSVPSIVYGQALAVDISLPAPLRLATLGRRRRNRL